MKRENILFRLDANHGREIEFFSNDDAQVSYWPKKGNRLVFINETYNGEYTQVNEFYIVEFDCEFKEVKRYSHKNATSITWLDFIEPLTTNKG